MRLASAGEAPAVEIAIASGPLRTIAGRMKLHSGGTSTTLTSIARALGVVVHGDVDVGVVGRRDHHEDALEVARAGVLALLPADRALARVLGAARPALGRDQRHVAVAGEQPLDLLQADVPAADHHAAPALSFRQAM